MLSKDLEKGENYCEKTKQPAILDSSFDPNSLAKIKLLDWDIFDNEEKPPENSQWSLQTFMFCDEKWGNKMLLRQKYLILRILDKIGRTERDQNQRRIIYAHYDTGQIQ